MGFLKFVNRISQKLFELGAWNLVSWYGMISKTIWARGLKLGQLIEELWPFENLGILNLSARYLETYLS